MSQEYLEDLREAILKEIKIAKEIVAISLSSENLGNEEKNMIDSQLNSLKEALIKSADDVSGILEDMSIVKPLPTSKVDVPEAEVEKKDLIQVKTRPMSIMISRERVPKTNKKRHKIVDVELTDTERKTLKRLKKRRKIVKVTKEKKANKYISAANKMFGKLSKSLNEKPIFMTLKMDLIKANIQYVPASYISMMLFTSFISIFVALFAMVFLLFFHVSFDWPLIARVTEPLGSRFLNVFWIIFAVPVATFFAIYFYPSLERKHIENKINEELPFATIHMSAISGSMVEPSEMFSILISTKEYPYLEKDFTKIINEINVYGRDFVSALRNVAFNSPSNKLAALLNGIATTINSGGSLPSFFDKRANTLLFEYRIEREKYTKGAETFMDIYISLVIAAPMILMLLLIMMKVSGLGISMSTSGITLVMVVGVTMINIVFLTFLQLKQPQS
mgnify:CR=1 FL=1